MFSFSASYLQIKSGLQIPQNYKYLISNKKVFLYKYAKIFTCVLTIIRGVVLTVWLMEQHAVSANVSHSARARHVTWLHPGVLINNEHMGSKCFIRLFFYLHAKKQFIFTDDLKLNAKKQIWHTLFKFLTIIKGFQYCSKF